jgi:putative hydrolase of HD superfamily
MTSAQERERLDLAYRAMALKDEPRVGWVQHGMREPESVAGHAWGTAYLCLLFAGAAGVDRDRAVAIAVVHDLAEAQTGDFAARLNPTDRQVSEAEKAARERQAIEELLPGAVADLKRLWEAYEERSSPEALFVRDMNILDMCLQGVRYERERRYDPTVLVPSQGGHRHLDEFFEGAATRLSGALARRLYAVVKGWYREARAGSAGGAA